MSNNYQKALPSLELLLDYLDGILDQDSSKMIEAAILDSDELRSIVEGMKLYYESEGRDRGKLEAYVEKVRFGFSEKVEEEVSSKGLFERSSSFWMRIAAGLIFLLVSGIYLFNSYYSVNADSYVIAQLQNHYEAPKAFRDSGESEEAIWQQVILAYKQGNYGESFSSLQLLKESDQRFVTGQFYKGLCKLYGSPSNPALALPYFRDVAESQHRLNERAKWFLALCQVQMGENAYQSKFLSKVRSSKIDRITGRLGAFNFISDNPYTG